MGQAMFKTEPEEPDEEKSAPQDELYWYSSPDGALVSFDGERSLVALPVGDERIPGNISGQEREIEGKRYMVYAVKNERIQR
jgi:glucose dehydrogenase